jgi:hypothetical protein
MSSPRINKFLQQASQGKTVAANEKKPATESLVSKKTGKWIGGNEGEFGDTVEASISKKQVTISGNDWAGTYPRLSNENVHGRDGETYYAYKAGCNDGSNRVLVDRKLLHPHTEGLLKLRCRGEFFFEQKYACTDVAPSLDPAPSAPLCK